MEIRRQIRVKVSIALRTAAPIIAAAFGVFILFAAPAANATQTVPYLINFQGRLTDNNGNVMADGSYNIKFRLFTVASGGSNVWEEDHVFGASDNRISVQNGLFNLQFGTLTAFTPALFNQFTEGNLYLEVELPTPPTATCASNGCAVWTEGAMTPRQPLSSSPYAFNSQTLDGLDSTAFGQLSAANTFTGANLFAPTTSGTVALTAQASTSADANALDVRDSGGVLQAFFDPAGALSVNQTITAPTGNSINGLAINSGALSGITGLTMASGDFLQSGTGSFTTGTGAVALNGTTTIAAGSDLILPSGTGTIQQTFSTAVADNGQSLAFTNSNTTGAGLTVQGINLTPTDDAPTSGTNTLNVVNFAAGAALTGAEKVYGLNFASAVGYTDYILTPTAVLSSAGALTGLTGLTTVSGTTTLKTTNSATALQVQNSSAYPVFIVDTTDNFSGNKLTNYGFEVNTTGWANIAGGTLTRQTTLVNAYAGVASGQILTTAANGGARVSGFTGVLGAGTYTFSFYAKLLSGTFTTLAAGYNQGFGDAGCTLNSTTVLTTGFQRYSCTFTTTSNLGSAWIEQTDSTGRTFYIDGVQLVTGSSPTPYTVNGALQLRGAVDSPTVFQNVSDSTTALQIQNASGDSDLFVADTLDSRIGIGTASPAATLDVNGTANATGFSSGGTAGSSTTCTGGDLLQNQVISGGIVTGGTCVSGGGANPALSNLSSTSINASLTPATDNSIDLGSGSSAWKDLYVANIDTGTTTTALTIGTVNASSIQIGQSGVAVSAPGGIATGSGAINGISISGGTVSAGIWQGTAVGAQYGGTGQTSYATGDLLYAGSSTTISRLADVAIGSCLLSGGTTTAPGWGSCAGSGGGATTALNNLVSVAVNANIPPNADDTLFLGSAAAVWKGVFTASLDAGTTTTALSVGVTNASSITIGKAGLSVDAPGGLTIGSGQVVTVGSTAGSSITCSGGQILQNQVTSGGIVTGGSCVTSSGAPTLQDAYNNSTSPATINLNTSAKDFVINANAEATDPNILFNLQCTSSCSTNGRFAVQGNGTDVLTVNPSGQIVAAPASGQNLTVNLAASSQLSVSSASAPTVDQVSIDNSGSSGVATNNVNGLHINSKGGAGAIEAAGLRIDYAPGSTSGSTWSGLRIVANSQGAATGINGYGIKLEGPTVANGGNDTAIEIASGWDIGLDVQSGGIQLAAVSSDPAAPPSGNLRLYAKDIAGRMLLKAEGSSGIDYPLQPSFFQNQIVMINGGTPGSCAVAGFNAFGLGLNASATTCSSPVSEAYGYMKEFSTTTTASTGEYVYSTNPIFMRGSVSTGANGFFFNARIVAPDTTATYDGSSRIFVGLTDQTLLVPDSADNPAGNRVGFSYVKAGTGRSDTDWQISTKNGTTESLTDTGLAFTGGDEYDVYLYCPHACASIYWRIDDVTAGTTQQDISTGVTADLPTATTAMRPYFGLYQTNAVKHDLMLNRIYGESDR